MKLILKFKIGKELYPTPIYEVRVQNGTRFIVDKNTNKIKKVAGDYVLPEVSTNNLFAARDKDGNVIRDKNGKLILGSSKEEAYNKATLIYPELNNNENTLTDSNMNLISEYNYNPIQTYKQTPKSNLKSSYKEIYIPKNLNKQKDLSEFNPIERFRKYFTIMSYGPENSLNNDVIKITEKK